MKDNIPTFLLPYNNIKQYVVSCFMLLVLLVGDSNNAFAQQIRTDFGKNRIQFNSDFREWLQYESNNFIAYWYGPARNVGQAAVQLAEYDYLEIQTLLEHKLNTKIEIIVYTDLTDVKQSNIGQEEVFNIHGSEHPIALLDAALGKRTQSNAEMSDLLAGRVVGNKMFVYFDGNHRHLRRQIREGIAAIYLKSMLFDSNLQERVQSAISYSLPEWFKQGITAYVAEAWNPEMDNILKDILLAPKFKGFQKLAKQNPQLAGHSFWYFISQTYGRQTMSNLLYLTRINRNIESGFLYIFGGTMPRVYESWELFFKERYQRDQMGKMPFAANFKPKFNGKIPITTVKISPDGQKIAYVTNEAGRGRVYVQDIATGKRKKIKKTGFYNVLQSTDYDYAIIAWKPNGNELSVLYEKRDIRKIYTYDFTTKKGTTELLTPDFQRVYSMEYISSKALALSATINGFSDIFIYKPVSRTYERITNDFYDDLDINVTNAQGQKGLIWASNRPDTALVTSKLDTILPIKNFDIFYLNLNKKENGYVQLTNTPNIQERNPVGIDTTYFAYLTDENGIINRHVAHLDSVLDHQRVVIIYKDGARQQLESEIALSPKDSAQIDTLWKIPIYRIIGVPHAQTNYGRNLLGHHFAPNGNGVALYFEDKKFKMLTQKIDFSATETPIPTIYRQIQSNVTGAKRIVKSEVPAVAKDTTPPKPNPYADYFQSDFPNPPNKTLINTDNDVVKADHRYANNVLKGIAHVDDFGKKQVTKFRGTRVIPYRFKYRTDDVSLLRFDNSPIVNNGELFVGGYGTPPMGLLSKITFKELLEDYDVEIGMRFSLLVSGQFNPLSNSNISPVPRTIDDTGTNPTYNTTEYYFKFANKKKRFDKRYTFYHKTNNYTDSRANLEVYKSKLTSDIGQFELGVPFDTYSSLRISSQLRLDKLNYQATDSLTLATPARNEQRVGLRADYIYDNILMIANNTPVGTRFKVYTEMMKGMRIQLSGDRAFDFKNGYLGAVGFDARHYRRLDNKSIIALRLAGATSFGSEKILYMIGGVEGALRPPLGSSLAIPSGNYAFMMQGAQMRGFNYNTRNGNSMVLLNSELRCPIIQYIFPNVRANWLKHFQVVGFFDVGTAWQGSKLFSTDNPLNTVILPPENPNSPVVVKVNYFKDPILMGTGYGLRTTFLGYFIKFDNAWGIETKVFQKPIKHFSIGLDF